jgi:hypothetical protein
VFASNATVSGNTATINTYGNIHAGNANLGNLATSNYFTGVLTTNAQPNITSVGTLASLSVTGLTTATGGVKTANIQDSSGTNAISTYYNSHAGDIGITGNLTVGTSGTGNITSTTYTSTIATGTAPLTVTSTTLVPNLYVAHANIAEYSNVAVATTGTYYPQLINASTAGNYLTYTNSAMTFNAATGALGATLLGGTLTTQAQPNITSTGTLASLTVTANISSGNANLGNLATASYFSGSGNLLSNIQGANVSGAVSSATTAATVTTAAQPNITSTGILSSLSVTGVSNNTGWSQFYSSQDRFSSLSGATGVINHDMNQGALFYHTSVAANFTPNFTNVNSSTSYVTVASLIVVQGTTAYVPLADTTNVQIGGSNIAVKWAYGSAPTGSPSVVQLFTYSMVNVGGTWTVMGSSSYYQ